MPVARQDAVAGMNARDGVELVVTRVGPDFTGRPAFLSFADNVTLLDRRRRRVVCTSHYEVPLPFDVLRATFAVLNENDARRTTHAERRNSSKPCAQLPQPVRRPPCACVPRDFPHRPAPAESRRPSFSTARWRTSA